MATFRHILILYLICGACCAEEAITFTTKSGRELHDVVVTRIDGQFVLIRHSKGVARLTLTEIPSDVRARLGMQGNALLDASAASIEELKPLLEAQLAKDKKSIMDFESSYESHLQKLVGQAQKAGQLERLMLVKAEIESFRKGKHQDSSAYPGLQKAQSIYNNKRPGIVASATSRQAETMRLYLGKLGELKKVLTQQGNLDKAVEVAEEEKRVIQLIEDSKKSTVVASPQPAKEERVPAKVIDAKPLPPGSKPFEPVPSINPPLVSDNVFELEKWPVKVALPKANYRLRGKVELPREMTRELLIAPDSTFKGTDKNAIWNIGDSLTVAKNARFEDFGFHGNLGSRLFFENCTFKDMDLGKGGGWFGGRFMSKWQFRNCTIEGSFASRWNSRHTGVQMMNCTVERVDFGPISYDKNDEPSDVALHEWATIRDTHFRKCVIPVSVLSLMEDCTFEGCRFIDDPVAPSFATAVTRTVFVEDCKWLIDSLPPNLTVHQKPISAKQSLPEEALDENGASEPQQESKIARISTNVGTLRSFREGQLLFTDKAVAIEETPKELDGLKFVLTSKTGSQAKVEKPGIVYVVTAQAGTPNNRGNELSAAGFRKENIPAFQLYGTHPWEQAEVYSKVTEAEETVFVGKYGIIVAR